MTSPELENLVATGQLKRESASAREVAALFASGCARLNDAQRPDLALASRFDLAYNAAHALALAALRHRGYRSEFRFVVFQALTHTVGIQPAVWRVLAKAHGLRNVMEYEGAGEIDQFLLSALIEAGKSLESEVRRLLDRGN